MENNLENKAKFFAQYLGCAQYIFKGYNYEVKCIGVSTLQGCSKDLELGRLLLKSLSDISELELSKLAELTNTMIGNHKYDDYSDLSEYRKSLISSVGNLTAFEADFLRKESFLIPFNGLSTEELISRGWAVTTNLKTE